MKNDVNSNKKYCYRCEKEYKDDSCPVYFTSLYTEKPNGRTRARMQEDGEIEIFVADINLPFSQLLTNSTEERKTLMLEDGTVLYQALPSCKHEIERGKDYSGIRCKNCGGWYCD